MCLDAVGPENINLTLSPSQEYYDEGADISLICSALSGPPALFKWFLNGDPLSDTGPELRLMNIQMSQSGNYKLRTSVSLSCSASGSFPSFLWLNGSSEVTASERVQLTDEGSTLSIINVTRYDQGPFICHVFNNFSNYTSDPLLNAFTVGPHNISITGPSAAAPGQRVTLQCTADSVPPAHFSWMFNGNESHVNNTMYIIESLEAESVGNYTCTARNMVTMLENSTVLNLRGKISLFHMR
uniref:Ig-like domain-containing protein n=1 Tax=Dicentrarchus labrax TaxID=13489 RepID=A0A8P4GFW8_DICLA